MEVNGFIKPRYIHNFFFLEVFNILLVPVKEAIKSLIQRLRRLSRILTVDFNNSFIQQNGYENCDKSQYYGEFHREFIALSSCPVCTFGARSRSIWRVFQVCLWISNLHYHRFLRNRLSQRLVACGFLLRSIEDIWHRHYLFPNRSCLCGCLNSRLARAHVRYMLHNDVSWTSWHPSNVHTSSECGPSDSCCSHECILSDSTCFHNYTVHCVGLAAEIRPARYKIARGYLCFGYIRVLHIVQSLSCYGPHRRDRAKDR